MTLTFTPERSMPSHTDPTTFFLASEQSTADSPPKPLFTRLLNEAAAEADEAAIIFFADLNEVIFVEKNSILDDTTSLSKS